ncbi:hypothetical protein V3C99_017034 [Haemonchus contortus]|uniref:INTS5_N domain-containing protein n=1 Tax=Haemonchus contortus TaxID=6289 RepID=A0A7I4YZP2_HAECO|nr:Hypothetical protein CBG12925 [Haemonchus contortus]
MEIESPASPGADSPASPTPCTAQTPAVVEVADEAEVAEEEMINTEGRSSRLSAGNEYQRKAYSGAEWCEKYRKVTNIYESFVKLTSMGDVTAVYRRPIWAHLSAAELIAPASDVFLCIPASRNAVLGYIGMLIHENAHQCFSKQENPQYGVDYSSVENAAVALMRMVGDAVTSSFLKRSVLEVLSWCCTISSELSQHNAGRLSVVNLPRGPESLLELFKMVGSIAQLIKLIDTTINVLLAKCPDECMTVLFDASRHGTHFNWIWLHIAITFPGSIVDHLFTVGADQFKAYVEDIRIKERNQVSPAILSSIHEDYNVKFNSLSDVFNFLTRRSNTELGKIVSRMIKDSLDSIPKDGVFDNLNFVFFFKLVTCSVDTLRFLITQNADEATPANFFRGIRQLMSVDHRLVLSNIPYLDFAKQMIRALDVNSLAVVFACVMQMALDPLIFSQFEHQDPGVCRAIRENIVVVVDELLNLIVRAAHSKPNLSVIEYPAIAEFASGKKLQFVINAAITSPSWAGPIVRYLHALSIVYGEVKGSEIVCRFIVECREADSLSALVAFLTTIVPYFPNLMRSAYESLTSVMRIVDGEKSPVLGKSSILRVLNNLRVIFEWESTTDASMLNMKHFGLYPDAAIGMLFCNLLYEVLNAAEKSVEIGEAQVAMDLILAIARLLDVMAPFSSQKKEGGTHRLVKMQIRYAYKLMIQLASLQRIALSIVGREYDMAISVFEEYRTTVFSFICQQFSPLLRGYEKLFLVSFLTCCIQDAKDLFGDSDDLVAWKYESSERATMLLGVEEAQKESFLDAIQSMSLEKRPNQLAHSGRIGKGARHLQKVPLPSEDALHRAHVFLDAMRTTCLANSRESNLEACKLVADIMTEALCHDALGSDFLFQDWDIEKDFVSKYLEISKRLDSSWISQGLMEVVAENPPCLWFMLPVIKAELATITAKFENVVDKSRPPSEDMLDRFDKWLYIVRKGDILSERFELTMDIIPYVSCYEGFLLLIEIWRHFQRRGASYNSIQAVHNAILKGEDARLHITMDGNTEIFRLVLQKNIGDLGHLFPLLCVTETVA